MRNITYKEYEDFKRIVLEMTGSELNEEYKLICDVSERQVDILTAGGLLDYTKENN